MANKFLFPSTRGRMTPRPDAQNAEGAPAYPFGPEHALAQYAATGCMNGTFYAGAAAQLDRLLALANEVSTEFLARAAVYCRAKGHMKDAPALLLAVLASRDGARFEQIFDLVVDNGRMLRNFVQIMRSGATGRKSLGTRPSRCVRTWLAGRSDKQLVRDSVGNDPSLADVIRMVHPTPTNEVREALYAWLLGRPHRADRLPELVRRYELWKEQALAGCPSLDVPDVPFQMLTALPLDTEVWKRIAEKAPWHMTRMNLNTFRRHGVLQDRRMAKVIANRLSTPKFVRAARVFPYQLLAAYANAHPDVPNVVRNALQDALELSLDNVPAIEGRVAVCPDVSGSMQSPITGYRRGSSSKVRCVDVAALVAAAILRKNPDARVLPFEHRLVTVRLNPRDTVMTNAQRLAAVGGGGTSLSAPLEVLARSKPRVDFVVIVSDNESWCDAYGGGWHQTATLEHWEQIKRNNKRAKLVCIDLQPNGTTQAPERDDVLNIGGFSDTVFELMADFAAGRMAADHWVHVIRSLELESVPN